MMNHHPSQTGLWFDYNGSRYKDVYDIRLKTGEVFRFMYPNGNSWYPDYGSDAKRVVKDEEVDQIRLKTDEEIDAADSFRATGPERVEDMLRLFSEWIPAGMPAPSSRNNGSPKPTIDLDAKPFGYVVDVQQDNKS